MTERTRTLARIGMRRAGPRARPARRMSGFTMVEMLAVLALAALMMAGLVTLTNSSLDDTRAQQAALYQSQLTAAATRLIRQNYTALAAQATTTSPVIVKMTGSPYQLSTYLSNALSGTNPYGQTPCLLVYAAPGGASPVALQALLVTEGGRTIPDPELGYIAANAGPGGGSIQATNNASGAATGAFGTWKVDTPNPANRSCTSTKTGTGHLASLIFYDGTQAQNVDYLYRVAVPGNPQANTMQVPIVLAQQIDYAACTQPGAIAADSSGNVLNCDGTQHMWVPQAAYHWREPVADEAALAGVAAHQGDVRLTAATNRAYAYDGAAWQALAVDEAGNLALGNANNVGDPCPPAPQNAAIAPASASTTLVSTDANGRVLSCRGGRWQTQSEIEPASSLTGCQLVMANPNGAGDYSACTSQPATNFQSGAYSYNGSNGTYSYTFRTTVNLTKPGIIVASTWAHLNDGMCNGPSGNRGQLSQSIDITDGGNHNLGHTESQTPTLQDDSGGINNALSQAGTPGTYTIVVTTNWATYAGITTPWVSSFCGESGQTVWNTPVAAGWTINSYY
ncbi:shufflon system plasmid conjugative transfer pilus tip adhesin PilV [Burkholderia sp. AU18528]|uniref:shufflon system plasmid conjugative transfer pilus tip adhesin PilV n=1 Tax=Burkholderia TaxID=32008 RepID=UPI000755E6D7|nr:MULTISPECIES: shufflon system plasmid conjugative transfer pilus tip adhesin PilV [Burkholderia]KVH04376.1 type IV prepilin [Burkholderia anthina]KVH06796.1 type IV prepilin [Burkholderia anthina]KVM96106.1 type IV prepilin [Burkholderia anthina]KVN63922.1 type IV prepilin [Burkholderia anthina]KVX33361.1 type IV prepilin [Burkholderia anthina]